MRTLKLIESEFDVTEMNGVKDLESESEQIPYLVLTLLEVDQQPHANNDY